jgi:hypothetical protein
MSRKDISPSIHEPLSVAEFRRVFSGTFSVKDATDEELAGHINSVGLDELLRAVADAVIEAKFQIYKRLFWDRYMKEHPSSWP